MKRLYIFGSGGFAAEVEWLVSDINRASGKLFDVRGFVVEDGNPAVGGEYCGLPVLSESEFFELAERESGICAAVAVGNPAVRKKIVENIKRVVSVEFPPLVHPTVSYDRRIGRVKFGEGAVVCSGVIITTNVTVGDFVHLNLDTTVGHDSVIGDFVTVSPGVHVSGNVSMGRCAFIGTGAVILENRRIGENSVVGAGAVVVKDVPAGVTVVGVPARPLEK